jgi:hypothetical protein
MKKFLLLVPMIVLLAVGCNSNKQAVQQTQPIAQNNDPTPPVNNSGAQEPAPTPPTGTPNTQDNSKTYTNSNQCYSIKYTSTYNVSSEGNLVNYNANDPKYEMGNPNGVKIQVQKRDLSNGQTLASAMIGIDNETATNDEGPSQTKVKKYVLGNIQYSNKVLWGPGGTFDVFYSPSKDNKGYYAILVWNMTKDQTNVNAILTSFTPLACK